MTDTTQASTAAGGLPGGWLRNFEEIVACTALTVVVLSTSWGVFTRYVSAQPATWSAEIAAVGFCWAIFLGSAAAFKRGQHISIDMLTQALPATVRRVLGTATDLLVLGFLGWVSWLAIDFTIESWSAEIAAVGFCWAIFLGSAAAFKRGQHISIDMLTQALPATVRRVLGTATDLLVLGFLGWVSWLAIDFTIESWTTPMPSLRWPYSIHYSGAALGFVLMTLHHARAAWSRFGAA